MRPKATRPRTPKQREAGSCSWAGWDLGKYSTLKRPDYETHFPKHAWGETVCFTSST